MVLGTADAAKWVSRQKNRLPQPRATISTSTAAGRCGRPTAEAAERRLEAGVFAAFQLATVDLWISRSGYSLPEAHHFSGCGLRWVAGEPPRSASPNLPMRPRSCNSFRTFPGWPVRISCGHRHRAGPSVHTAPVLRRRSMGSRSLVRNHILLAAGAVLRFS
jgi:hypothetical protein